MNKRHDVDPTVIARLRALPPQRFCNRILFLEHLAHKGVDIFDKDTVRVVAEAGISGSIHYHGLLGNAVIVCDDAGQFRIGDHALC